MMESGGSEVSHCLALSLKDNGNSLSRMASSITPLSLSSECWDLHLVTHEIEYPRVAVLS